MATGLAAESLIRRLRVAGVKLELVEGRIVARAARGAIDAELASAIRESRDALIAELSDQAFRNARIAEIPRADRSRPVPLTHSQEQIWIAESFQPGVFNMSTAYRLPGELDVAAFARAVRRLQQRHQALRCSIETCGEAPAQIARWTACRPYVVDFSRIDPVEAALEPAGALLRNVLLQAAAQPFDLAQAPLMRVVLAKTPSGWGLLFVFHHLIADGWSLRIIERDLGRFYQEECGADRLPPEEDDAVRDLFDFAAWQRAWTAGDNGERHQRHWREVVSGAPLSLELPKLQPRIGHSWPAETVRHALGPDLSDAVRAAAAQCDVPRFAMLFGAWAMMLSQMSGKSAIVVTTPLAGRDVDTVRDSVGCFTNTVLVRCDVDPEENFAGFVKSVNRGILDGHDYQCLPPDAVQEVRRPAGSAEPRLFESMLSLQVEQNKAALPAETGWGAILLGREQLERDFSGRVIDEQGRLDLVLDYAADLYDPALVRTMVAQFESVLREAARDPQAKLSVLMARALGSASHGGIAGPSLPLSADDLADLVPAALLARPDSIALTCGRRALSGEAANDRIQALARRLAGRGAGPETLVGLCLPRSLALPIGVMGIWCAGAGYAPVAADWPDSRLAEALDAAGVAIVVSDEANAGRFRALGRQVVIIDADSGRLPDASGDAAPKPASGSNLAYAIFTSGSTGGPKAVAVERAAVCNLLAALEPMVPGTSLRGSLSSSIVFDASVEELLGLLRGFSLHVLDHPTMVDALLLGADLRRRRLDLLTCTPTTLGHLLAHGPADKRLPATVIVGGEAMPQALWDALQALPVRAINSYGPTECSVDATWTAVAGGRPHVGKPMANLSARVLDRRLRARPAGAEGELCLAGNGLARGYIGRPDLTADAFRPSPHGPRGSRLYRTGDRARLIEAGGEPAVELRGRLDAQVKVRGFRVETEEVESILSGHDGVAAVAVMVIQSERDEPVLTAYVEAKDAASPPSVTNLKAVCLRQLPPYMVPSVFVVRDALPRSETGKLNRIAMRSLKAEPPPLPATAARALIHPAQAGAALDVIGSVLARPVALTDNFVEAGGTLLAAIRVSAHLRNELGCNISGADVLASGTLGDLVQQIAGDTRSLAPRNTTEDSDVDRRTIMRGPASFGQQQLWILDQLGAAGAVYAIVTILRLREDPDILALIRSLSHVVARHAVLRTYYEQAEGGELEQVIQEARPLRVPTVDLSALRPEDADRTVRALAPAWRAVPFDLARPGHFRAAVLKLAHDDDILFMNVHHIAFDGWSMQIFFMELQALYAAYLEGGNGPAADPLPPVPIQYIDFAVSQRALLQGEQLDRYLDYWRDRLRGLPPVLDLPSDRQRPQMPSYRGKFVSRILPSELTGRIDEIARQKQTTPFTVLMTCFLIFLSKLSGRRDVVTGTPYANRTTSEVEGIIGYFVNTVVVRADIDPERSFLDTVEYMRDHLATDFSLQDLPFEQLVNMLRVERVPGASPIIQSLFTADILPAGAAGTNADRALKVSSYSEDKGEAEAKFDITVGFEARDGKLQLGFNYSTDLFDHATGELYADRFSHLVQEMLADFQAPVGEFAAMLPSEVTRLEGPKVSVGTPDLGLRFDRAAAARPDSILLSCEHRQMSAEHVERRSGAIADALAAGGAGPDVIIAICLERSIALPVAILAVWRVGGAHLPLDPDLPDARIAQTLGDSGVDTIVTSAALAERFRAMGLRTLIVDEATASLSDESVPANPARRPAAQVHADNLAYVLFTSGSTGRPKGVAVTRGNLANLLDVHWATGWYGEPGETRASLNATVTFDVSVGQIGELLRGGHVRVLTSEQRIDSRELDRQLRAYRLDVFDCTPSQLMPLLEDSIAPEKLPKTLLVGGEAVPPPMWRALVKLAPAIRSINGYGPTEFTIYSTTMPVEGPEPLIGRPVGNCFAEVVDRRLRPLPPGATGELCLSGANVARGYAGRPELTAELFRPDPSGPPGSRLYRTGDIVRVRPSLAGEGESAPMEMIGRADNQMKLRGFRIEAGEIEAVLRRNDAVRAAVVVLDEPPGGDKRLVAFIELTEEGKAAAAADEGVALQAQLTDGCRDALPLYMIPSLFQQVDRIPLTPSGKVDRRALPPIEWEGQDAAAVTGDVDPDSLPGILIQIWAGMLGSGRIGVEDNFFELGGSSLMAMRISARLRDAFDINVRATDLLATPTISALAARIEAGEFPPIAKIAAYVAPKAPAPPPAPAQGLPAGFVRLREGDPDSPLAILPHASRGTVDIYRPLAEAFDASVRLEMIGIESPLLHQDEIGNVSISKMARAAAADIVRFAAGRPIHLIGWSFGGVVAHELAVRLDSAGLDVASLVMLDSHSMETSGRVKAFTDTSALEHMLADFGLTLSDGLRNRFQAGEKIESVLGSVVGSKETDETAIELGRGYRLVDAHLKALAGHRTKEFEGAGLLVRATVPDILLSDWSEFVEDLEVVDLPVGHADLIAKPTVDRVAELLRDRIAT